MKREGVRARTKLIHGLFVASSPHDPVAGPRRSGVPPADERARRWRHRRHYLQAGVDDPGRFRRSRDVGPHFGLTPRKYQSGEKDVTGSISKVGDRMVRNAGTHLRVNLSPNNALGPIGVEVDPIP